MSDTKSSSNASINLVSGVILFWFLFFCRGCTDGSSSIFDEYMKAAYSHVVSGVVYEKLEGE